MSARDKYILDGKTPVPADLETWANWYQNADRRVAETKVGAVLVSTVFIGLDHNYDEGEPHIFETMIFGGSHHQLCERCSTWEQAEDMHQMAVNLVGT